MFEADPLWRYQSFELFDPESPNTLFTLIYEWDLVMMQIRRRGGIIHPLLMQNMGAISNYWIVAYSSTNSSGRIMYGIVPVRVACGLRGG